MLVWHLCTDNKFGLAGVMRRFSSRSDESADLTAFRDARQRPPQTYCTVR